MVIFDDPRVMRHFDYGHDAYKVVTPDGTWEVVPDGETTFWVAIPPNNQLIPGCTADSYLAWFADLPRFWFPAQALESVLSQY